MADENTQQTNDQQNQLLQALLASNENIIVAFNKNTTALEKLAKSKEQLTEAAKNRDDILTSPGNTVAKSLSAAFGDTAKKMFRQANADDKKNIWWQAGKFGAYSSGSASEGFLKAFMNAKVATKGAAEAAGLGTTWLTGAGAGLASGGLVLAIWGAAKGLQAIGKQILTVLKENLSYEVLATNYLSARGAESRLGNFEFGGNQTTGLYTYSRFRNIARRMGMRDDKELTDIVNQMASAGIAGGRGLGDLYQGALSAKAAEKVFGLQYDSNLMQQLYRGSQGNRGILENRSGLFDVQRLSQNFAYMAQASKNQYGATTSTADLFDLFKKLASELRGTNQDFGALQRNMMRFTGVLTNNEARLDDVAQLYTQIGKMSSNNIFRMLAFAGVGGGELFREKERVIQGGFTPEGMQRNAMLLLRSMTQFRSMVGGDRDTELHFLREQLMSMGLTRIAKLKDPITFLEQVRSGNKEQIAKYEELSKNSDEILLDTANKLDKIEHPVKHIRDFIFAKWGGGIVNTIEKLSKVGGLEAKTASELSSEYADATKDIKQPLDYTTALNQINTNLQKMADASEKGAPAQNSQLGTPDGE